MKIGWLIWIQIAADTREPQKQTYLQQTCKIFNKHRTIAKETQSQIWNNLWATKLNKSYTNRETPTQTLNRPSTYLKKLSKPLRNLRNVLKKL